MDFNSWTQASWALLAVLGALVFVSGIALWRWRTVAIALALVGAALLAASLWKGDPIWTSVAAVGTLLLGWGLSVLRRRPKAAPWLALIGILAALTGIGTGNLWTGGKSVVETFANTAARVNPPSEVSAETTTPEPAAPEPTPDTAQPPAPDTQPPVPDATQPTPDTAQPAVPDTVQPPTPDTAEPPTPDTLSQPPAPDTATPDSTLTPPTEPSPPEPTPDAAVSNSACPCTLDVGVNVQGAAVQLVRDGQEVVRSTLPATFDNLSAGDYTLRVQADGYKPYEGQVSLNQSRNHVVVLEQ